MRRMGKVGKNTKEAESAEENYNTLQQQLNDVQAQLNQEINQIPRDIDPSNIKLDEIKITPKKSDISVEKIVLIWWPN
jgi:hypothetical protein